MYKNKPDDYKMKYVNYNPEYKYLGNIGDKREDLKRVTNNQFLFENRDPIKKIKTEDLEQKAIDSILSLNKLRCKAMELEKDDNKKKFISINEFEKKKIENEMVDLNISSNENLGKIKGITKN